MSDRRRLTLEGFAAHYGLVIELETELPDSLGGFLDPHAEPRFIAVNANLPRCEQAFTIAHEIAHHVRSHQLNRRKFNHWLLNRKCTSWVGKRYVRFLRVGVGRFFSTETEADLIAVAILLGLGMAEEAKGYLERHPEKKWMFAYVTVLFIVKHPVRCFRGLLSKIVSTQAFA